MNIRKWLCKTFGHKWGNMGLIKLIGGKEQVSFTCKRCREERITDFSWVKQPVRYVGKLVSND